MKGKYPQPMPSGCHICLHNILFEDGSEEASNRLLNSFNTSGSLSHTRLAAVIDT